MLSLDWIILLLLTVNGESSHEGCAWTKACQYQYCSNSQYPCSDFKENIILSHPLLRCAVVVEPTVAWQKMTEHIVHVIVCVCVCMKLVRRADGETDQTAIFSVKSNHMSEYNYVWICREQNSFQKKYVPFLKRAAEWKWGVMLEWLRNTSSAVVLWARHRALFLCSQ